MTSRNDRKHGEVTAEELMARLNNDPAFVLRRQQKEQRLAKARIAVEQASAGILEELTRLGYPCTSVSQIVQKYCPLPSIIADCIIRWIPKVDHDIVKEALIRALGAAEQKFSGRVLADSYDSFSHSIGVQFAVLNTIAMTHPTDIDDFISRIAESEHIRKQLKGLGYKFKKQLPGENKSGKRS